MTINGSVKITGSELSDMIQVKPDTLRKMWTRRGHGSWSSGQPLPEIGITDILTQYASVNNDAKTTLNAIRTRKSAVSVECPPMSANVREYFEACPSLSEPQTVTVPESRKVQMPKIGVEHLLSAIVIGHCFLVVAELADIFKHGPGLYAGIAIFGLKIAAVWISLEKRFSSFAEHAVSVCFLLDFLCVGLHRVAFARSFDGVQYAQIGYENMIIVCWVLSVVVSGGAFASLFFIKKIANLPA